MSANTTPARFKATSITDRKPLRWALIVPAMVVQLIACFFYFVWYPGTMLGNAIYVGAKTFILVWPFVVVWGLLKDRFVDHGRFKLVKPSLFYGGVFGLITAGGLIAVVNWSPIGDMVFLNSDRIAQQIGDLGIKEHFLLFAVFISLAHAFLEEFFWRLFVFGQLRKLVPIWVAVILAAVGFASHHVIYLIRYIELPYALMFGACVGIGGAVWSLIYQRTNSLWGPWFSHMIVDIAIMLVAWQIMQAAG